MKYNVLQAARQKLSDPRWYQIITLTSLTLYGLLLLDFEIAAFNAIVMIATALGAQYAFSKAFRLPAFEPKSALISSLSLCLLLRVNDIELAALAAFITIAGKFLIRVRGKHIFNPTNFGIATMLIISDNAWVSPGQWGSVALFAFALACIGLLVVMRARRSDVTYAFLAFYGAIVFGRALWLGDPIQIPLHQLQSGAFIIFTFFMISDPRTTPDSRIGRILFALLVALGAGYVQFVLFQPNGFIWSLAVFALTVPVINIVLPGARYEWNTQKHGGHNATFSQKQADRKKHHAPAALRALGNRAVHSSGILRFLRG